MSSLIGVAERGYVPDPFIRLGIRSLLRKRLRSLGTSVNEEDFIKAMRVEPVAVEQDAANDQHYELPPEFFDIVLGPNRKYSGCLWEEDVSNLQDAEQRSLYQVVERAELADGMEILELGCGWGSLTLWMAKCFPNASITAVSNSAPQRKFIEAECEKFGYDNVRIITADVTTFSPEKEFDRVVSIEMFEHMRNHSELMTRIHSWLKPTGKLFVHIFTHRNHSYLFETDGAANWMGRYFFTGGMMPSRALLEQTESPLKLANQWWLSGDNYAKTAEAWLDQLYKHKDEVIELFSKTYGEKDKIQWYNRWRIFFLSCAELFGYSSGEEWGISHYLFEK